MKIWFHILGFTFLTLAANAQDIHFSQFFFSPQTTNPAEVGVFNGKYRLNANQKTQWREVSRPYSTFALMGDGHFDFLPEDISLGLIILNDQAGDSRFNTFSIQTAGSYALNLSTEHSINLGVQVGATQIKISQEDLTFNNQYNGVVFDPNLSSGEDLARLSRWYANLNLGALYEFRYERRKHIRVGLTAHNILAPDQSFYNDTGVNLPLRYSAYVTSEWKITERVDAMPSFRYMSQSTFQEIMLGAALRVRILEERDMYRAVFLGYYGRLADSGIAMGGFELDAWRFAVSYDINMSELDVASRNRGGLEFSLQYIFGRKSESSSFMHKYCPVYL